MSREALVVGINGYPFLKDPETRKPKHLSKPAADAEAIAQVLETYGNFRVRRMPEIYTDGTWRVSDDPYSMELPQINDLKEAIGLLFNPPSSIPDTAVLYFAGHGLRSELGGVREGFLATSDANPKRGKWGVSFSWLRQVLQNSPVGQKLIWLDCCHSGGLLNFNEADPGTLGEAGDMCLIAASREFEVAHEEVVGKHGVLTGVLLTALDPNNHQKPWVTNYCLVDYINTSLAKTRQRPVYHNFGSEIVITGNKEQIDRATLMAGVCPYKGLESFGFNESDPKYFYGRTALVDRLVDKLRDRNFLAVVGASGSGKSSVVKAGLLYQLTLGQRLSGSEEWKIVIFRPGEHPLENLKAAFGPISSNFYLSDGLSLAQLASKTGYPEVVLVADQLEEAFTLCQDVEEREQFMSCLLGALEESQTKLRVIITMRADFFGKCAEQEYSGLAQKIQDNLVTVRPMNQSELREAILKPALVVGLEVQRELVEQMLWDVEGPGNLPLLQYTLWELWQNRQVNRLTLAEYTKLGGVKGTLPKRAEEVYQSLSEEQQLAAKRIFLELMQLGEGTEDTRRQILKRDLINEYQSEALVDATLGKLVDARLLVTGELLRQGEGEKTVTAVDVAHEALIRNWSRLRGWVDENREAIRLERQIESVAEEWLLKRKSSDYLLSGVPLVEAQSYLKNYSNLGLLSKLGKEFIERSRKRQRRNRGLQIGMGVLVLFNLSTLAIFSTIEWQKAELRADAASVNNLLDASPVNALTLAIKTIGNNENLQWLLGKMLPSAQSSLRDAIVEAGERNLFQGHNSDVTSVAFSPDGKYIVSGSYDETLRLWDLKGNPIGRPFRGHDSIILSVAFSPGGKYIVSGSFDNQLQLWDLEGNAIGEPFRGHDSIVTSVAFSPGGRYIVSGSDDKTLRLWDLEGNQIGEAFRGHESTVLSVAFSPGGKYIVSGSADKTLRLWDLEGNQIGEAFRGHESLVYSVAFSPDGKYIVSGSFDSKLRLWDLEGNQIGESFRGHESPVLSVAFSPDGKYIVSGSFDNSLRLWNLKGNQIGEPFKGHNSDVLSVAFSSDGKHIVSGSADNTLRLWSRVSEAFRDHDSWVNSVAFSPDGKHIVSGSADNTLRLWSREGNPIGDPFKGHESPVLSVAFSPDGKYVVSGSGDNTLRLWSREGNPIGEPFKGHESPVLSVAFSPDSKYIVSGGGDKTLRLWNLEGNQIGEAFRGHENLVYSVAFSPGGKYIVSGSTDKTLRLWDLEGNPIGKPFTGHDSGVTSVAFSPDGKYIASGSENGLLRLWSLKGKPIGEPFRGHHRAVFSVAFSPDGKYIVSGSSDGTLRLWSLKGKPIGEPFRGHNDYIYSVAFSPDGKYIVSGSRDGTLQLWHDRHWKDWLTQGCNRLQFHPVLAGPEPDEVAKGAALTCQKYVWDDMENAEFLIRQGRLLVWKNGDVQGAIAKFSAARQLDDTVDLSALASEAKKLAATKIIDQGRLLAREKGDIRGAVAQFSAARRLDDTVDLSALASEAKKLAADHRIDRAKNLIEVGQVKEALAAYAEAEQLHGNVEISASSWNNLCWDGTMAGEAAIVMNACDRAVDLEPENGGIRDSRGIARALTGDLTGAIEDFQAFLQWSESLEGWDEERAQRQRWIDTLRAGENPFTPAELDKLR